MSLAEMPYFMTNKEWYCDDENGHTVLTDKAPPEAVKSYEELQEAFESRYVLE